MFDHVGIYASNLERSKVFYEAVLPPLGYELLEDNEAGESRWALSAPSVQAVDSFHAAGLGAGGTDNGTPGPRATPRPYYAAFLLDPDGNNVEAGFRERRGKP